MKFEDAIEYVLGNEGEYSNDSSDRGGETKWGISSRAHPDVDIKNLTREQAIEIYRKEYWEPNQDILNSFTDRSLVTQNLTERAFDCIVNTGRKNTVIFLQRAYNAVVAERYKLKEDGIFGEKTQKAVCDYMFTVYGFALQTAFCCERASFYRVLVAKDPTQERFLRGWLLRSYS